MRKRILFVIMATMVTCVLAACGTDKKETDTTTNEVVEQNTTEEISTEDAENGGNSDVTVDATGTVAILNDVWETYSEDEKFFAMGGDMNNPVDNAAGNYSMEDTEGLTYSLYLPADSIALVDEAASLIHAMNANTFTGAAFHLVDAANAETLATALKDNILNTQWMCGFPEKLMIIQVNDEYVISAFGNGEIMDNFKNKVTSVYGEKAVFLVEETIG